MDTKWVIRPSCLQRQLTFENSISECTKTRHFDIKQELSYCKQIVSYVHSTSRAYIGLIAHDLEI